MSDMKCPFCNETELDKGIKLQNGGCMLGCPKCKLVAPNIFWQVLIDTKNKLDNEKQHEKIMAEAIQHHLETEQRLVQECMKDEKKLDIAVGAIKKADHHIRICHYVQARTDLRQALDKITALEQKDVK